MQATAAAAATASPSTTTADADDLVFDVLFTGTGQSSSVPLLKHVLHKTGTTCKVCEDAMVPGSKNKRNNVSAAIIKRKRSTPVGETPRISALIDAGKTFREVALHRFPRYGLKEINALLLTHGHADAILGMDDLRDMQMYEQIDPGVRYTSGPINVVLHDETMTAVKERFSYLTNPPVYLDKANGVLERPVSYLTFNVIDPNAMVPLALTEGVPIQSFPVHHGGDYVCLGFSIGKPGEFVYISDVKDIPPTTMAYLKSLPVIKTLVLDCIKFQSGNYAHAAFEEVKAWVDALQPQKVWLVGMGCGIGDHDEANRKIQQELGYPQIELAWDGLYLEGFRLS